MKHAFGCIFLLCLSACATSPPVLNPNIYPKLEIDRAVSNYFDVSQSDVARALKPSFKKFGSPTIYVQGQMSAVHNAALERLYGTGEARKRLNRPENVYWQIDGNALGQSVSPVRTVHLVYQAVDSTAAEFSASNMDVRRGQTFTVFERLQDDEIIVSLYPTKGLPPAARFDSLKIQTR